MSTLINKQTGFLKQKPLAILIGLFSLMGSIASFLLLYERIQLWQDSTHSTACDLNPWVSCGAVMESWQASTFGFPNIFIGTTLFPALTVLAIALLLNTSFSKKVWSLIELGTTFAFGFIVWLWYSAVFSIGVLCPYCMIIWAAVIPLSILVFTRNRIASKHTSSNFKQFVSQWWWATIILLYLAIIASIVIKFPYAFAF